MEILELYKEEQKYWKKKNIDLFGINPIDERKSFAEIQASLDKSCEKYWNVDKACVVASLFKEGILDTEAEKMKVNSFELKINPSNMCVDVYNSYKFSDKEKHVKIAALPFPSIDLSWIINRIHYTPRITAITDNNTLIAKHPTENRILGEFWTYNIDTKEFSCVLKKEPFEATRENIFANHLSKRSKALLQSVIDEELTEETFELALSKVPTFNYNSIFNYKFSRFEYFEELIRTSQRLAAIPSKGKLLGINTLFSSQANRKNAFSEKVDGQLVLSTSSIFSLENFRTVINIYTGESEYTPTFSFIDTTGFFDSFKTATSNSAGRQRLLLDNISVKDGMLWIRNDDGTEKNMYEYFNKPQDKRISCLSYSKFCFNDQSKRIMMTAKLTSQAVPLKDEKDDLTHRISARAIFADIEGYTYGDSIIISKSFAKKLKTYVDDIIYVSESDEIYTKAVKAVNENNSNVDNELLALLYPTRSKAILSNYEKVKIKLIDKLDKHARVFISYEIPFGLGDKITNLHGAKGTVGLILPDEEMPILTKQAGNMEPGPLDIVISGFSTIRRGSLGQIFEAWANANDIDTSDTLFINTAIDKYSNNMKKFAQNSVIEFKGKKSIKPIGIIDIMRLHHHASTKISESSTLNSYKKMLKLGEQEKLNLLSQEVTDILKELAIRSMHKYSGPHRLIAEMQQTRELPENPRLMLKFAQLLKSVGYDIKLDGESLVKSDLHATSVSEEDLALLNSYEVEY